MDVTSLMYFIVSLFPWSIFSPNFWFAYNPFLITGFTNELIALPALSKKFPVFYLNLSNQDGYYWTFRISLFSLFWLKYPLILNPIDAIPFPTTCPAELINFWNPSGVTGAFVSNNFQCFSRMFLTLSLLPIYKLSILVVNCSK